MLESSALYRMLLRSHRPVNAQDVALFAAIVQTAKEFITAAFPGAQFHVIFWDYDDDAEVGEQVQAQLRQRGVPVHPISTLLPKFPTERARCEINPYDRHPNAVAHALIAEFVSHTLVQPVR